jgi:hypothetical protein
MYSQVKHCVAKEHCWFDVVLVKQFRYCAARVPGVGPDSFANYQLPQALVQDEPRWELMAGLLQDEPRWELMAGSSRDELCW